MLKAEDMTDELYSALKHSGIDPDDDNFLAHYGVMGMKWGQRQSVRSPNPDYTQNQRKRDRQIYGRRGEKRINKNLNRGDSISVARGDEKTRRDTVLGRNKYVRQAGKVAGVVGGAIFGQVAIAGISKLTRSQAGKNFIFQKFGAGVSSGIQTFTSLINTPQARVAASAGAAYVGNMMAGDIAVSINTRAAGYNPRRK